MVCVELIFFFFNCDCSYLSFAYSAGVFAILSHEKPMGQDTACVVIEKVGADNKPTQREFAFSVSRTYPLDLGNSILNAIVCDCN